MAPPSLVTFSRGFKPPAVPVRNLTVKINGLSLLAYARLNSLGLSANQRGTTSAYCNPWIFRLAGSVTVQIR